MLIALTPFSSFECMQTLAVLNPFRVTDAAILQDTDLAGPLAFILAFGGFLLLVSGNMPLLLDVAVAY